MINKKVSSEEADERLWELLYLRSTGQITPARFVRLCNIVDMRETTYAPYPFDGEIPGSFRILAKGLMDGVITAKEYEAIAKEKEL